MFANPFEWSPVLGAIGSFWVLVILVLGSAIVDWLKKRSAAGSERADSTGTSPAPRAPDSRQATTEARGDWEEELRRLLGEPSRPAPPPVAKPPPIPVPVPVPVLRPHQAVPPKQIPVSPAREREPAPMAKIEPDFAGARKVATVQMSGLRESSAAYESAARLPEQVARHLKDAVVGTEQPGVRLEPIGSDAAANESMAMISLLRTARTARQAIIASVILGAPKGLTTEQSGWSSSS